MSLKTRTIKFIPAKFRYFVPFLFCILGWRYITRLVNFHAFTENSLHVISIFYMVRQRERIRHNVSFDRIQKTCSNFPQQQTHRMHPLSGMFRQFSRIVKKALISLTQRSSSSQICSLPSKLVLHAFKLLTACYSPHNVEWRFANSQIFESRIANYWNTIPSLYNDIGVPLFENFQDM